MMTVFDEKGRPASVYGVGMDMTAQQQEKENYAHMYRQLVDSGLDSIGSFHLNLTKNWCGHGQSKYPSVLKLQAEGTVDGFFKTIAAHIPDEAKAKEFAAKYTCQKALEAFHQGQTHLEEEFLVRMSSGDLQWTKAFINLVQNPSTGDIEGVTNSTNITARKKSEAVIELITREKFDYIGILNLEQHTFEYINIQIAVPDGKLHHKENSETARQYIRPLFPDQKSLEHFDQCTALPNIKAHMQEQNRLRQTQTALKAAEQANRAKTDFVSRISHDIRTPLSAISNMTEFALEDLNDPAKLKNDLLKIRTSNEFLLSLINDILDISKIDSGKVEFNPEPYPYQEYITRIKNMFEPLCAQKNIKFIIMPRPQAVGTMLADKIRINQITLNLISNAIKYTPPGGNVTYISHSRNLPEGRMLFSFEIKDDGIGMSEAFLKVMFEPFTQEHNNPRRPQGLTGTGLGLSIVKHIVDQMGGTLTVKSKLGQGTSVICAITFPNADLLPRAAAPAPAQLPDTAAPAVSLHGRVLLAEDNKINTEIAQRILGSFGLSITPAANGLEAVEFFKNSPPGTFSCILMDIQMPFLNGYEATAAIRALRRADAKTIPILAMTADAFAEAVDHSRQAGMNEHVTKPLNPAHLRQVLRKYLG
jgi:signal transduction histidine kinase/CheY-like chemotaxis protein